MQLKSLKVFCDVVGRRSFSRAADENGITQSGASQMVHGLEEELGVKLIDRSKRPFVLTPEGELYYDGCRKLIHRLIALEEEVRTLHQAISARVNVASIYSVGLSYVNHLVEQFKAEHPKAVVQVEYEHPDRVYELVQNNEVDFGLVSFPRAVRGLKVIPWLREPMICVCSPDHDLARRSKVEPEELDGMEMVGFDDNLRIRREIDQALAARQIHLHVTMDFDNLETLKRAVEMNSGLSFVPEPAVRREVEQGSLAAIHINGLRLERPIGVIHAKEAGFNTTTQNFLNYLLTAFSASDPPRETARAGP